MQHMLSLGVCPQHVLAVTFTKAAAGAPAIQRARTTRACPSAREAVAAAEQSGDVAAIAVAKEELKQKKVELFVRNVLGKSPPSITELLTAFLKQEQYITSFLSRLAGSGGVGAGAAVVRHRPCIRARDLRLAVEGHQVAGVTATWLSGHRSIR